MKLEIFNEVHTYNNDFESYCDQNCILQILSHYGVRNPMLYMDTSLNIHLFKDIREPQEYNAEVNSNLLLAPYEHKIHKHCPGNKSGPEVWEENKGKLKEGIPIITGVDMFCLPYSYNYKTYHSTHKAILCGYTEDNQSATLVDCYEWTFRGDVSVEEFINARSSLCPKDESPYSGYPIENVWQEIEDSNWSMNIRENLKDTIDKTIKQYYENELTNGSTDFYGIAALKKIKELLAEKKEINPGELTELITKVRIIFLRLYSQRKLFRCYLNEAYKHVNLKILSDLQELLNEEIESWRKSTIIMLKGSVSINENSYRKIINKISELIEAEEKRYDLMKELSSAL